MKTYSTMQKNKIKRMSHQLELSEQLLKTHPLVNTQFTLLQTVLHYLRLQLQWSSASMVSRLLMAFQIALNSKETARSATGFIGPSLNRVFKAVAQLMESSLKREQRDLIPLMDTLNQLLFLGTLYIASQLLGNWKQIFPQRDPDAAFKAGLLLKELGLTFLLGSHVLESSYSSVAEGLNIDQQTQKQISNLGMCFILSMLVITESQDLLSNEEFIKTLQRFMYPTLESIKSAIQEGQFQGIIESEKSPLILAQIQLIKQIIEKGETTALKKVFKESCELFDLSYEELIKDLKQVTQACSQLNTSFKNIFYQSQQRSTTLTQSA